MSAYDFMWEVYKDNIKPKCDISNKLRSDIKDGIDSEITIIEKS